MVEIFEVIGSNRATMVEILLRHSGPILSNVVDVKYFVLQIMKKSML